MWFLRSGSCIRLVGRNQLWHSCTSGLFTGQINQAAPGLGYCPESTVWRESHLTPVHGLKGASIITIQHSPCHLPFLFSSASSSCSFSSRHLGPVLRFYHHHFSFLPLPAFSTSPSPRMICYSLHTLQLNRLPSESCDLRRHVISSPLIGCMPLKSVVTVSYYIVYLPGGGSSRTVTIFKSARSGMATAPCLASLG